MGYERYGAGSVLQCIHKPQTVTVHWLHMHSFCVGGRVDDLPSHDALCAEMTSSSQAEHIAELWAEGKTVAWGPRRTHFCRGMHCPKGWVTHEGNTKCTCVRNPCNGMSCP